jgi:hypothetical protein
MVKNSTMLKPAKKNMAFAKVGLYGKAGSGKTRTSAEIAIGLYQYAKLTKPVAVFDTEPAYSFMIPFFEKAGIELMIFDESRAFADLMTYIDQVEEHCSIVIVDSITHIWKDIQASYIKRINITREAQKKRPISSLEFHHWGPIKSEWATFTDRFLASKIHFILCGRAGSEYSYQLNDRTNKMELISTGDRMATEKELAHEPSLLIEMVKIRHDNKIINRALVEKDRSDFYNGAEIDMPNFNSFIKHFEFLNIGGEHFDSLNKRDSTELFNEQGEDDWSNEKRMRDIYAEEIKALFVRRGLDGTAKDVKEKRGKYLYETFGTGSWTAITSMKSDQISNGYNTLKQILEPESRNAGATEDIPQ